MARRSDSDAPCRACVLTKLTDSVGDLLPSPYPTLICFGLTIPSPTCRPPGFLETSRKFGTCQQFELSYELAPSHVEHRASSPPWRPPVGLPRAEPSARGPASPWGRPESF